MNTKSLCIFIVFICFCLSANADEFFSEDWQMKYHQPIESQDSVPGMLGERLFGYYNISKSTGKFLLMINYQYQDAGSFNKVNYVARVKRNGLYGFIKMDNATASSCIYDDAKDMNDAGYAMVRLRGRWGVFCLETCALSVLCVYDTMDDLYNGWYEVSRDGEWGYVNRQGYYASSYSEYQLLKSNDQ